MNALGPINFYYGGATSAYANVMDVPTYIEADSAALGMHNRIPCFVFCYDGAYHAFRGRIPDVYKGPSNFERFTDPLGGRPTHQNFAGTWLPVNEIVKK